MPQTLVPVTFRSTWWEMSVDLQPEDQGVETGDPDGTGAGDAEGLFRREGAVVGMGHWLRVPVLAESERPGTREVLAVLKGA